MYTVTPREQDWTLKTLLQSRLGVSRKLLSRIKLTERGIMLNGQRVYISVRVSAGDVVEVRMERESSDDILPEPMDLDILHEDSHLLIVNKAAGVIVHPTHGHYTGTLANGVVHRWLERGEQVRFRPVHRLDRETSGVLAIAKNPYVHQHISEQMIAGTVDKVYRAFVHGRPLPETGRIEGPIDRDPDNPHVRIVTEAGYPAATRYRTLETYPAAGASLVELELESGRTHQIRVHMTHIGCPLIGDAMYKYTEESAISADERAGAEALDASLGRQALHAFRLAFVHPGTGERVTFEAPYPSDLSRLQTDLQPHKKEM
ncbi:RluA family pseudouridine synthase [Saccharibacillus sp. CPCC 101409]|uniref:RluA family pseudouridine synthase n=1 Tax=Saccharibacillus sp. CPCC 101409 TaxID=3058041 RepID=UPI002670EC2F|nr:RluA family pseudouridine synthase [Saccharibacillus sp. CPCC 101409]MDO3408771.1 RluA family pseudouridine synthase [Saccharibacillus sp. CPCC 101409]